MRKQVRWLGNRHSVPRLFIGGLIGGLFLWPYGVVITADSPQAVTNVLFWLAAPILLTALFFTVRDVVNMTVLNFLAILALPVFVPGFTWASAVSSLGHLSLLVCLLWLLQRRIMMEKRRQQELEEANRALQESETQLSLILEATPVPISISRITDGTFLFTNTRFNEAFGYTAKTLQQLKSPALYAEPTDRQRAVALFSQQGFLHNQEILALRSNGETFWVTVWVELIRYQGEQMLLTVYQDVTERKQVEEALRRSTERLMLMQQIEQGIISAQSPQEIAAATLSQIQQLIPCQRVSLALFDYEAETALLFAVTTRATATADMGRYVPLSGFSSREVLMEGRPFIMQDMLAAPRLSDLERQRMTEEGIRSYINVPLMYQGAVIGSLNLAANTINSWTDEYISIASELAAQLAIAVSQARLRETAERRANELEVLRQIGLELVTKLDLESLLQLIVSRASELVNAMVGGLYLTRPDLDGVECVAVSNDKGMPIGTTYRRGEGATGLVWQTGEALLIENYDLWPGKLPLFVRMHISLLIVPVRWGDTMLGVLSIVGEKPGSFTKSHQALLELFAAQAAIAIQNAQLLEQVQQTVSQLEHQNAELERFTYTVSHDLKSPLVTVQGFLGFLEKDIEKGDMPRALMDIARIREAAERMHLLLNDLLELSRIGRLVNPPQCVSFNSLVEEALEITAGRIAQHKVTVTVMPDMPKVLVDRPRLIEVLQNLIDNAAKYMGEQPEPHVDIGCEYRPKGPVFYVRDNGMGIEPQYHEKVFGLFERLDNRVEGTGIGLALVKRIVEVHNGRIWLESAGKGQGTTFFFTLGSLEHDDRNGN